MSKENILKITLNSAIGLGLVILWLKLVDINEVLGVLKSVQVIYLVPVIAAMIASTVVRSLRLKILLKNYNLGLMELTKLNFLSQLLSFLIPIRAGEITKAVYLSTKKQINFAKVVIWILLDRFFDFWTVFLLLCLLVPMVMVNLSAQLFWAIITIFIVITLTVVSMLKAADRTKKLFDIFESFLIFQGVKKIYSGILKNIFEGFLILKTNFSDLPKLILLSVISLVSDAFVWFFIFLSLNIKIPILSTLFGSLLSMLTFLIPAAPGYVGSAEGAGLLVFAGILGLDKTLASAAILVNHGMVLLALPIFGLVSLYFLDFNLKSVWQKMKPTKT